MDKITDWKGNEIKEGMTIYFVQTKPFNLGRMGWLVPEGMTESGKPETIMESYEDYEKRNQPIWELGDEMIVMAKDNGRLYVETNMECNGELNGYTISSEVDLLMQIKHSKELTIAIKGISDTKEP